MKPSISSIVHDAGQGLLEAAGPNIGSALNQILNRLLGWPFFVATGYASDSEGKKTDIFDTLIYTTSKSCSGDKPLGVQADNLACVIDISESMTLERLRTSYEKIACAKRLIKSPAPHIPGASVTTITLGIALALRGAVPIENLAEELDTLNRRHPCHEWLDMIVMLSDGIINYGAQLPGERQIADFLPPAEGALAAYIPPMYVIPIIRPTGPFTFNKMCAFLVAHLGIFSPGANLPNWAEILDGVPKEGITRYGYQYNLSGQLVPVPRQFYEDRYLPPRPVRIENSRGSLLCTLQFIPWQDGGVILLRGKFPLEAILSFLDKKGLDRRGFINRPDGQISHVLPISQTDFVEMLQRIQRQSRMIVSADKTKLIIEKFADEGSSSPFIARLFMGIFRLRELVFTDPDKRAEFDKSYDFIIMTLLNTRKTAQEILRILAEHVRKVSQGEIARVHGHSIQIDETIDKELRKEVESFLNSTARVIKGGMQDVTEILQVSVGFVFQKPEIFEKGVLALEASDPPLAAYLREVRKWSERLLSARNAVEHDGWMLPKVRYMEASGAIHIEEPQIAGQRVSEFVEFMMDRVSCFVEEVTVHCLQARIPAGITITELPIHQRETDRPERFEVTLQSGGKPVWTIAPHQSTFEEV